MSAPLRVALGLLAFCLLGLAITDQEIYSRLSYFWAFLILGNYALSRVTLRGIRARRWARALKGQVGDVFEETFEIENLGRFPKIWIAIEDQSRLPNKKGSRLLTLVGGRRTRNYVSRMRLTMRGAYALGPTVVRSGDPFGFFPVSFTIAAKQNLTVYPQLVEVTSFPSPMGLLPGGDSVRRRTHQITPNAATVREYATGDPISRIHWPSTARRERLMVKEFELDPMAEVWLFLDAEARVHYAKEVAPDPVANSVLFGRRRREKLAPATEEYMASIAASVARCFLQQDRSVALTLNRLNPESIPPDRGGRQFGKILEALALLRADGRLPMGASIADQARHLTRGSTVVLVTPSPEAEIAVAVVQLLRLGLRPVTVLLDAESFGGPKGSAELARTITDTGSPSILVREGDELTSVLSAAGRSSAMSGLRLRHSLARH